jgi:hypothetical protein
MPNNCNSTIVFIVPDANRQAFLADIAGPADWHYPLVAGDARRIQMDPSGHDQLRVVRDRVKLETQYREMRPDYPVWMPIPTFDLFAMTYKPEIFKGYSTSVPLSFAKLSPLTEDLFNRMIPGNTDEFGVWTIDQEGSKNSYCSGITGIRDTKIGVRWPPNEFEFEEDEIHVDENGMACIGIRYTTPWGPIVNLPNLLNAVLMKHGAKALLTWVEEDSNAGYDYCNPAEDRLESETFEHGRFYVEIEDDDGETHWGFDYEGIETVISDLVDDPDF